MGSWLVGVGLRGFRLGIALGDSVHVREGLSGIAVGGRGVRPRDGEARDRHPATAAASAAGHCDGDGVGGASEDEYRRHSSTDAVCESPQKKREEEKESGGANDAMVDKECSIGGEDGRRKELACGVDELRWGGRGRARLTRCRPGQMSTRPTRTVLGISDSRRPSSRHPGGGGRSDPPSSSSSQRSSSVVFVVDCCRR